ncbi:hypothetical protein SAMN04488564_11573 [Lentzea waywayandensis]|uniref:Uncharacterized protein n=1 Tax=Lentzea waywayandensis TaxID=84724 RepID=A0A1I6FFS9_9PSEU|nr:hypothetical protein [Lentzea waywayandensis]SFR28764.1 hypothetical protein SAMN04488564_11573 [Lentzea waywayandensis]
MFEPYLADYRYYALFESQSHMSDIGRATGLHRSISAYREERYEGHGRWELSIGLSRSSERDSYADYREASPAEVEYLKRRTDEQQQERPQPSPSEPAGVVALLAARRHAEPVDGHYYFAEFDELADVVDVDRAHALIRCPASGGGKWEMFLHEGTWVPGEEPRRKHVLPVGREDVERISRARESAETRYFDVWLGFTVELGFYRHVLVRRTGSVDETTDDLGWQSSDVLGRLEPGWWVAEFSERGFRTSRYVAVMMGRARGFRGRPHDYQAVFHSDDDVYDFGNVLYLVRQLPNPYELEYERWTPDGWQRIDALLGKSTLPISEEEFHRLAASRPDERDAGDLRR